MGSEVRYDVGPRMKAGFVTTAPNDVANVIAAWDFWNEPSTRIIFDWRKTSVLPRLSSRRAFMDETEIIEKTSVAKPDVIFYIGGAGGKLQIPTYQTLRSLREIAPSVNFCFDAGDLPWHATNAEYRKHECFDLHITIDGTLDSPVDHVTTAPVNTPFFEGEGPERDIPIGISGNLGPGGKRSRVVGPLLRYHLIQMRQRDVVGDGFQEHVDFMRRCRTIINTSYTGSGLAHHVKQRVWETGWAGAALIEHVKSPLKHWISEDMYFTYENARHAKEVVCNLDPSEVADKALRFSAYVKEHYTPQKIYGGILDRL